MDGIEKCCGNCAYANYYKRNGNKILAHFVDCEVYSCKKESTKVCTNWKERKIEKRGSR